MLGARDGRVFTPTDEIARQPYFYGETSGVNGDKVGGLSGGRGSFAVFDGEVNTGYAYINSASDEDWFSVILTGGVTYQFTLSADSSSPGLDPYLEIRNSSGVLLAFDDDSGEGNGSTITFTAPGLGTYYLCASGYGTTTGGYGLSARAGVDVLDSIDWGTKVADATVVNVYFAPAGVTFDGDTSLGWNVYEIQQVMSVLQQYENVCAIDFVITDDPALADFKLLIADVSADGALGYLTPPGEPDAGWGVFYRDGAGWDELGGPGWNPGDGGLEQGGYGYVTLLHEIGHGLGLAHPHDTGGISTVMPGVTAPFGSYGTNDLNQGVFTVMSYNDGWPLNPLELPTFEFDYGYEGTPMALDVALLQQKYGANTTHNGGDDTYVLPWIAAEPGTKYACIWDTGGTDTIVYDGYNRATIDLRAATVDFSATSGGVVSYVYGNHGGFTIAQGVVIENATGGAGDDTITGNDAANTLKGGGGQDTLDGGLGNDVLDGGWGSDRLDGGAGTDTASYADAGASVAVDLRLSTEQDTSGAGIDTLLRIENLLGSAFADWLTGDGGSNTLTGGKGDDVLDGGAGDDVLDGGDGYDTAVYAGATSGVKVNLSLTGAQNTGGAGTDTLTLIENVTGSAFADTLTGDGGANLLTGGKGDDVLDGGAGDDVLNGGDGYDTAFYAKAASGVTVDLSLTGPQNTGGAGIDTLIRMNHVTGSAFADTLTGDQWGNTLIGGKGDDVLEGGGGNDRLDGGDGYDTAVYASATSGVKVNLSLTGAQNTGGAGTDTLIRMNNITGSAFADVLTGDQWGNTLIGGAGDDILDGGAGNDRLDGGEGFDTAVYAGATSGVKVNLSLTGGQNTGGAGSDTLIHIENVTGSAFADTLTGDGGANLLTGGKGDDVLDGGAGDDVLNGGDGYDTAFYAKAASGVTVNLSLTGPQNTGGAGVDTLIRMNHVTGSNFADTLTGDQWGNTLVGGKGDDVLEGGGGNDRLDGGDGYDTASYAGAASGVTVNLSLTGAQNTGGAGIDTLIRMNNITGSAFADVLTGDQWGNTLTGGEGDDVLDGGGGNDRLTGGAGNDVMTGGAGDDLFVFGPAFGHDRIDDFVAGGTDDRLDFSAFAGSGVTWTLTQVGEDAVIAFSNGDALTLAGVNAADLAQTSPWGWG